ncbi:peptidoglycan DD-metalloendopeptidase family protein [Leptospira sp. 201903071]|uniref:LIC_10271 family cell wall hydrolase n=1 Tax=Leptospira ainazelensis TaxID=2810034 RepID=UPI00196521C3|nr:M23 family metallopeptidase [Leptospira ainazelensis]MBM9500044.1 peptidoglycan DD-metalloendopeptidase family protein [Leptospira ainazelensis]
MNGLFRKFLPLLFFPVSLQIFSAGSQNLSVYNVQRGDTYYSLGKKFNVDYHKIMEWNGKKKDEPLIPGEPLKVRKPFSKENEKIVPKTARPFFKEETPDSSRPLLRFPLKSRPPVQSVFSKLSFAPNKGVLFKASRHNEVRPASPGKVLVVDEMDGYKKFVILEHKNGYSSVYANLKSVSVTEGETVDSSRIIGSLESGKGLYFQLNRGSSAVDPDPQIR